MKIETRYNIAIVVAVAAIVAAFAASAAPTANEDYVDRQDAQTYTNAVTDAATYTDAATNGAVTAANAYTDAAVADAKPSDYDTVKAKAESAVQPADLEPYCTIEAARRMTNGVPVVTKATVTGWGFLESFTETDPTFAAWLATDPLGSVVRRDRDSNGNLTAITIGTRTSDISSYEEWNSGKSYRQNDIVRNGGKLYICCPKNDYTQGNWDSRYWREVKIAPYSFAVGSNNVVGVNNSGRGFSCSAFGRENYSEGLSSISYGLMNYAGEDYSIAIGLNNKATGYAGMAIGANNHAKGWYSQALGYRAKSGTDNETHHYAFVWQGINDESEYNSHGSGTFNINPRGGIYGFWIGSKNLAEYLADATPSDYNTVKANAAAGASAAGRVEQLNLGYTRLYNFSTGATNANFTATNYPPTKAEADARCHFEPEPGMDFSKVPASLQLNEYRNGEWRTVVDSRDWAVWYFKFKERQLTNEIARLKVENAALSNRVEAAKSWADRTANGIDNPMTDTVVVDRPNMWIMADYEWQKVVSGSNQCFVIRAKNVALSGGGNTNGFLEVVDAFGKPYMRINKSAETFADPVYEDIYQDQTDGAWYVVFSNSTKPTKGGANVALRGNGDGKCILFEETDPECPAVITWPDVPESHSGHWIMKAVPKPVNGVIPSAMFFGAEIKVPGSDYVEYLKEASFGAGIRYGNNVYEPQESGNQLIFVKRND